MQRIEDIEFILPVHKTLQDYVVKCRKENRKPNFSDLYDLFPEEAKELSSIARMEVEERKKYDQEMYFADCVKTLALYVIDKKLEMLSKEFKNTEDNAKRQQIAI